MTEKDSNPSPNPLTEDSSQSGLQTVDNPKKGSTGSFKLTNSKFGNYEIVGELGSGGMGVVYKAFDPTLKRFAALKLIRTDNPDHAIRFVQEARAQARVQHENVCRVYEVGEVDGKQYIAMQFIEGKSLYQSSKEMSVESKIRVIQQIAEALHVAHKQGLIHRDIKPSNIMLERTEEGGFKPYVLDFGLARDQEAPGLTRTGIVVGTPYYMAPEQVSGERDLIDRRTDVYGLGATLYELVSGKHPYEGKSGADILLQILKDDPIPIRKAASKIPQDLETIVMKCLERDPARRYESSKALAEDLHRYLDGESLAAKPATWSYRLLKRAKKNRLATGIGIAAALTTVVLISSFLWVHWQNKLQAEYAREFGDEVKNIQSVLPNIYTAPLHDIRPEIAELRNRLEKMEARVKEGGRAAEDPGNNALGQGYLALGDVEKARIHLEKAWNSGYQLPSTAYALGQTMGLLFQKKMDEAERNPSKEVRTTLTKQYEDQFKRPAVEYLKKAQSSVESPAYVEGLIALYEKQYDEALKKAKEAYDNSRWSYDAKTLEGKAYAGIAQKKYEVADYKGAIQQYELAGKSYAAAAALGRSRSDIYLSDCERWGKTLEAQTFTDANPSTSLKNADEACNKAIVVNPDLPTGYLRKASVYNELAKYQSYNSSEDPRNLIEKAKQFANEALSKDPKNWEPHEMLLLSNQLEGEYELHHGIDALNSLQEAIKHAIEALKIQETAGILMTLGITYENLAEYEDQNGRNPVPIYEKAIAQFRRIEQIDRSINPAMETGICIWSIASYQMKHGDNPLPNYDRAIQEFQKYLKKRPDDPYGLYNLGNVFDDLGHYQKLMGKDPMSNFQQAIQLQQKTSKLLPNNSYVANALGYNYVDKADYLVSQGKNPTAELNEARKYLTQAIQIDTNYYMPYINLGDTEIINAQWVINQKQSPIAYFDAARKAYLKSIDCNKEDPSSHRAMALAFRMQADWEFQEKRPTKESIDQGLKWIEKSLNLDKVSPESNAARASLILLQAREEKHPEQRKKYADSAASDLENILKRNPILKREYEPFLKEAKSLLSL